MNSRSTSFMIIIKDGIVTGVRILAGRQVPDPFPEFDAREYDKHGIDEDHFSGTDEEGRDYYEFDLTHVEPEPAPRIDMHSVLVTSTAHLTFRDQKMLTRIGYRRGEYGWLLHVGRASDPTPEVELPSAGLEGAIRCARDKGCVYLLFDDGRELPGVPINGE